MTRTSPSFAPLAGWIKKIQTAELTGFDTETTSLDYMEAKVVGLSLAVSETAGARLACYIPLAHDYPDAPKQLDRDTVLEALRPWLEDPSRLKVGHHLKYDAHVLANHGIRLRGIVRHLSHKRAELAEMGTASSQAEPRCLFATHRLPRRSR